MCEFALKMRARLLHVQLVTAVVCARNMFRSSPRVSCSVHPIPPYTNLIKWNEDTCSMSSRHLPFVPTKTHKPMSARQQVFRSLSSICPPHLFSGWRFFTDTVSRVPEPDTQGLLFLSHPFNNETCIHSFLSYFIIFLLLYLSPSLCFCCLLYE